MKPEKFFSEQQRIELHSAIIEAELNTSGEIRVHVEESVKGDVLDRAAYVFEKLGIHETKLRNGVLFYLAIDSKKYAILGDAGINTKVPENFWDSIKNRMAESFTNGDFAEGLGTGIILAGEQLKKHFPYMEDDVNELSDDISYGKK